MSKYNKRINPPINRMECITGSTLYELTEKVNAFINADTKAWSLIGEPRRGDNGVWFQTLAKIVNSGNRNMTSKEFKDMYPDGIEWL